MIDESAIPHFQGETATQLVVRGKPVLLLAGEVHNSSASSLEYMEPVFDRVASLNCNAVLAPFYWELIEPQEGRFDFTLVDGLIEGARRRGLHLVPLWFGTIKNAISCYAPEWVKTDLRRFPRAEAAPGRSSWAVSVFGPAAAECDARAFAAVMRRIAELDRRDNTVVMVQVENEMGVLSTPRDRCELAEAAFASEAPSALMEYLAAHRNSLGPELAAIWGRSGFRMRGRWETVFPGDAEEVFMAWHMASFVERIARAGRAEYDLPMFANAWLVAGPGYGPGQYPSGGPVSRMMDVWKAAAPHIDTLAPDIYGKDFAQVCADYTRRDNPLLIPETSKGPASASNVLYAVARHGAVCFAPFGIDDVCPPHPLGESYLLLREMMPLIVEAQGTERLTGFVQERDNQDWEAEMQGVRFRARTARSLAECRVPGGGLLLAMGQRDYVMAGRNLILSFEPTEPGLLHTEIIAADAGWFEAGRWMPTRRLNGDETDHGTRVLLGEDLQAVRFRLHSYR